MRLHHPSPKLSSNLIILLVRNPLFAFVFRVTEKKEKWSVRNRNFFVWFIFFMRRFWSTLRLNWKSFPKLPRRSFGKINELPFFHYKGGGINVSPLEQVVYAASRAIYINKKQFYKGVFCRISLVWISSSQNSSAQQHRDQFKMLQTTTRYQTNQVYLNKLREWHIIYKKLV